MQSGGRCGNINKEEDWEGEVSGRAEDALKKEEEDGGEEKRVEQSRTSK